MNADNLAALRQYMIAEIAVQAIYVSARIGKAAFARRVMQVMDKVPRHAFVPIELKPYAYSNSPLPIGFDKTISQPFIVALMTDLLDVQPNDTLLEIGTGLGYQAAIVAALAQKVYRHRGH
jgi:protein-L-isoaspartate(D-aspartate) O-methyltransferase